MARTIQEIEAARAERKANLEKKKDEQLAIDLEQLDELEMQHGDGRVIRVDLATWMPGLPTFVALRLPTKLEMKRYQDQCKGQKADPVAAANLIGDSCRLYPSKELYEKVLEIVPGIHVVAAVQALERASGKVAEEGKG